MSSTEPPVFPELGEPDPPSDHLARIRSRRAAALEVVRYCDREEAELLATFPELRVQP